MIPGDCVLSEPFRFTFTFTLPRELCRAAPTFTFTFTSPPELRLEAPAGCVLTFDSRGQVAVEGNSREQVFAQARRFLRVIGRGCGPLELAATLRMARQDARERAMARRETRVNALVNAPAPEPIIYEPGGCDSWSIVTGADVVIAAAAIASIARQDARERADVEYSAARHKGVTPVFAG